MHQPPVGDAGHAAPAGGKQRRVPIEQVLLRQRSLPTRDRCLQDVQRRFGTRVAWSRGRIRQSEPASGRGANGVQLELLALDLRGGQRFLRPARQLQLGKVHHAQAARQPQHPALGQTRLRQWRRDGARVPRECRPARFLPEVHEAYSRHLRFTDEAQKSNSASRQPLTFLWSLAPIPLGDGAKHSRASHLPPIACACASVAQVPAGNVTIQGEPGLDVNDCFRRTCRCTLADPSDIGASLTSR